MPLQLPPRAPVTVVCGADQAPVLAPGWVVHSTGDTIEVELGEDVVLSPRARIIVELPPGLGAPRLVAVIGRIVGRRLTAQIVSVPEREKREYPRLPGFVGLRYWVASGDAAERWARGEAPSTPERVPDLFMNFSATGLAFEDTACAQDGDLLLLELSLPGTPAPWRCTARVVRVFPIPPDERDPDAPWTHRVATFFEDIPPEATVALAEYTLQIQNALLEGAPRRRGN